LLDQFAMTLMS